MRRQLFVGAGLVAALVVAIVASGTTSSTDNKRPARALPTQVLVRPAVTVSALRGEPAAINFWASWCDPCRKEAAGFARLPAQLGGRARIVGVGWNDGVTDARLVLEEYGWHSP